MQLPKSKPTQKHCKPSPFYKQASTVNPNSYREAGVPVNSISYLEAGLHSFEQALLKLLSYHTVLVDDREAVANSSCLFEPVAPPDCILL